MHQAGRLLSILSLGFLAACGGGTSGGLTNPGQPPPTNAVSGTVTLRGLPLAGVQVSAYCTNDHTTFATATTDAQGGYRISGLCATANVAQEYLVWANLPGYGFFPSSGAPGKALRTTQEEMMDWFQGCIGMNFSAVDFVSTVQGGSLASADFAAFDGSNPRVRLARTGQSTSYAGGDDGASQAGAAWPASRFTDNQDGTVTDQLTGLVWLKDAGFTAPTDWAGALAAVNALADGSAGLKDGSRAGDWRLPNINELESLVDASRSHPALAQGNPFVHVADAVYWSSTSYYGGNGGSPSAWTLHLGDGRWVNDGAANLKTNPANCVWAVKGAGGGAVSLMSTGFYTAYLPGDDGSVQSGVGLTSQRFRDNGDGTLTDTMTGLVWLKRADAIDLPWDQALAAVQALHSGQYGLTDGSAPGAWRMPNRAEMLSLADRMQTNHADWFNFTFRLATGTLLQAPVFTNFQSFRYYWTSTTDAADPTQAWTVYSCDYGVYGQPKAGAGFTLAVR